MSEEYDRLKSRLTREFFRACIIIFLLGFAAGFCTCLKLLTGDSNHGTKLPETTNVR